MHTQHQARSQAPTAADTHASLAAPTALGGIAQLLHPGEQIIAGEHGVCTSLRRAEPIKPIRNEADDELALQDIDRCLDAAPDSPERDGPEVLIVLVDDHEAIHHPISPPDPIAAIEFVLEHRGLSRQDLEGVIGSSGSISEAMNKQRPLTLAMIRKLGEAFQLPADVLIRSTGNPASQNNMSRVTV